MCSVAVVSPCGAQMVSLPDQGKVAGAVTDAIDEEGGSRSAGSVNLKMEGKRKKFFKGKQLQFVDN